MVFMQDQPYLTSEFSYAENFNSLVVLVLCAKYIHKVHLIGAYSVGKKLNKSDRDFCGPGHLQQEGEISVGPIPTANTPLGAPCTPKDNQREGWRSVGYNEFVVYSHHK